MNNEENSPDDLEKPEEIIDDITSRLDDMHEKHVKEAAFVGYLRDAVQSVRPIWERLGNSETLDPDSIDLYNRNYQFLRSLRDEVRSNQETATPIFGLFENTSGSVSAFISATSTTAAFVVNATDYDPPEFMVVLNPIQHEITTKRFMAFDESLGKTYQEIWEVLYGTRADPERAALYLIRQAFDHLFGKLAPDNEVRNSPLWALKEGDKPEQVWRVERVRYAACTHIKDSAKAEALKASSNHMLSVYEALNRAHERKNIDRIKARKALEEMRMFLEDWANAVGI